jgi:dCMP deaminase
VKEKYARALLDMAERFGQTSTAERLKVGALIYKNDSVIALGVNGQPPKWPDEICEELITDSSGLFSYMQTLPTVRHAELAALEKLWNSSETAKGATMFISHSPCKNCSIKILTAGIEKVYYKHSYRSREGIDYLLANNVEVIKLED